MVGANPIGRDRPPEIGDRDDGRGVPQVQSNQIGVQGPEVAVNSP